MITETEAYGRKNTDKMALFNTYKNIPNNLKKIPISKPGSRFVR